MDPIFKGTEWGVNNYMTKTQEHFAIEEAQSEIRTRVLEIRALPDDKLTSELRSERDQLDTKYAEGEVKFRASIKALRSEQKNGVTIIDAEARELQRLSKQANVGDILSAAFEKRQTAGETAELQKHFGLAAHQVPLEMLRINRGVEERAAATVPDSIGDAVAAEVITPVFASGDGAFLGVERPTVPVGDAAFPVLGTSPSVKGPFSDSSEAAQTDATFTANSLAPERLQASFSYRRTDAARFAGLDPSLRLALNSGLEEALDKQAISGTDGLLTATNLANNNVNAVSTFALYLSNLLYGRVDGRYARIPGDVRALVGQSTFAHAAGTYKGNNSDESVVERLGSRAGGLRVSPHVPAVSGNKQNALIRLGMERGAAVQPMWQGVSLIVDEFTRAAHGEVIVHAVLLANFAITRTAQWSKRQTQHA